MIKSQASQYALIFLTVCAAFVALKLAEQVLALIVLGLVIGVVLAPFSDLLERMRLPQAVSGLVTILIGERRPFAETTLTARSHEVDQKELVGLLDELDQEAAKADPA
jgi:hypothetical protein